MSTRKHDLSNTVPLKTKIWLSSADGIVATLAGLITGGGLTYYFTKWMGLKASYVSIAWLIFGIWNAVNDPLFGYLSDRTKSNLGRRIPYIRYGAPLYALAFIISWIAFPWVGNQWAMFFQMLISLFLFDALYTAIATSLYVMPYEITVDNQARGSIFIWKVFFSIISLGAPLILMPLIQPEPGESATTFRLIMTCIGIVAGIYVYVSTFFYQENNYVKEEAQPPMLKAIVDCFKNRPFLIFEIISFTVIYIQTALMQGVLYYFAEFNIPMTYCYGALLIGAILGLLFWIRHQEQLGVNRCIFLMCLIFSCGCLLMAFFGNYLLIACIGFFATGIGFSGGMYLVPLMNGDVIDYDELHTGLRREGIYAGVNSFITKPAISLAQSAFLTIITALGYIQNAKQGTQSPAAKSGLLIGWMLIPAILLFICSICMMAYPLKGDDWKGKKEQLKKSHAKKEALYTSNNNLNSKNE
ncbi:sugar transporter [Lachnospiraceae bacterium KM106-2]|nr:sugar transporter [Lachnospiraceae bacterium KM106-2]